MNLKQPDKIIIIGIYLISVITIISGIKLLIPEQLWNVKGLLNWDAEHYLWIKDHGYEGFRVAFFPLFPLFWKLLHVDAFYIAFINGLIFLCAFYVLARELKLSTLEILIYISIPSFMFFYLPYSESLFFLSSTILILGIKYDKISIACIGLLLATLTRPAFAIFIPALIITEFLSDNKAGILTRLGSYLSVTLIGILLVSIIQYIDTGEWFRFFNAQKGWGNELQFPKLPLSSWGGGLIVRLDGTALLIGTLAGGILTAILLKLKPFRQISFPKEVIFSLAYLGGISLSVLVFRGGVLFSLNRFVFATPFIIIILNYWIHLNYTFNTKQLLAIFGFIFLFWLLFGSYVHIQALLKFLLLSFYVSLIFVMNSKNVLTGKIAAILLIIINAIFQIIFYFRFLNGGWVG